MSSARGAEIVTPVAGGPDGRVEGRVGRPREVLIEIDGGIEEVLSAEPVIRSLQRTGGGKVNITVCAGDEALFRNHPGVREIVNRRSWRGGRQFDMCWRLGPDAPDDGESLLVDTYARRLGVQIEDRRPRIYLDSFDMLRMQRFGIWRPENRRIVLGAGTLEQSKAWDEDKWLELCDYLAGRLGATLIQVGRCGERFFGYGHNLIGKLTARDVATVLKSSDLLISVDNDWQHLAGAVGRPAVVLTHAASAKPLQSTSFVAVSARDTGAGEPLVRDITIESVLDGMARLHGHEHLEEFEHAVCA